MNEKGWSVWCGARLLLGWVLSCLLLACGGTTVEAVADVPDNCVGAYSGNFSGDIKGTLDGDLGADASFQVTFVQTSTGQSVSGSGSVAEDGTIEVALGPNVVSGAFNFDQCKAKGVWNAGDNNGSWAAARH
jgi:hypothetical protein